MVTTGSSWAVSFTACTLGTSTSMPNSITWAVSMKMMSSTSTTSTNGVMLISDRLAPPLRRRDPYPPPPLTDNAMALLSETAFGHVQELHGKVVHARADLPDSVAENVVEDGGWDGGCKARRRRNQRFGDARRHRAQAGRSHLSQFVKRADNAQHGAEQPNERRDRRGSGQPAHVALELGDLLAHSQLQGALQRDAVGHLAARLDLTLDLLISEIEDGHQRRRPELLAGHHDRLHAARFAERAQKTSVGLARAAKGLPLGENHGPGKNRNPKEDDQHNHPRGPVVPDHFPDVHLEEKGSGSFESQFVS